MNEKKRATCERCGMDVAAHMMSRHYRVCQQLPLPADLAREFLDDDALTGSMLSMRYLGYSSHYVSKRLDYGLKLLGEKPEKTINAQRTTKRRARDAAAIPEGAQTCPRCGMAFGSLQNHAPLCERTPLPADLAREFVDSQMTYADLSAKYATGRNGRSIPDNLRHRLAFGLKQLGIHDDPLTLHKLHRAYQASGGLTAVTDAPPDATCKVCGTRLCYAPEGEGDVCGWCLHPTQEWSRTRIRPSVKLYRVTAAVSLLHEKGRVVRPSHTIEACDMAMARRGMEMRLRAKYGERGLRWEWKSDPVVETAKGG